MIKQTINTLLLKGETFAVWAKQGEKAQMMVAKPHEISFLQDDLELDEMQGFIFAPFQRSETCPLVILHGKHLKSEAEIAAFQPTALQAFAEKQQVRRKPFIINQTQYEDDVKEVVSELNKGNMSKLVLSRIHEQRRGADVGQIFQSLRHENPRAMVYVVSIPKVGTWIGATPEILLQSKGDNFETMSLAGTQAKQDDGDYRWRTKEIEEQAFVSRYLLEAFHDLNIHPYLTQGPDTLESGTVAHLRTNFQFERKLLNGKLSQFLKRVHPTPAVCGLPKADAMNYISKIEKHKRRYYTGYLGTWQMEGETNLFVNLRCMELVGNQCLIYVGGGITSRSIAIEEWEETEKKARVLTPLLVQVEEKD
ncbi:MAG: chorismate-binding protein [Mangrovibacterium sp.]